MSKKIETNIERLILDRSDMPIMHTTCGVEQYAHSLGFKNVRNLKNALMGKKVLDATAGYGVFALQINIDAQLLRSGTKVYSVDPFFIDRTLKDIDTGIMDPDHAVDVILSYSQKENEKVVAWTDGALPFPDQTFDFVFDHNCFLLWYNPTHPSVKSAFLEMKRVLKPDGQIRTEGSTDDIRNDIPFMRSMGFNVQELPLRRWWFQPVTGFILTK